MSAEPLFDDEREFYDQALAFVHASQPEEGHTPGPDKIIAAINGLTYSVMLVGSILQEQLGIMRERHEAL